MSSKDYDNENDSPSISCCIRFRAEFGLSFFGEQDVGGRIVDVQESFNRAPFWKTFLLKSILTGWSISVMVLDIMDTEEKEYYFMYLTHWGLLFAVLYLFCSFVNTLCGIPQQPERSDKGEDVRPSFLVRFTWGMFSMAAPLQLLLTVLYWGLEASNADNIDYTSYMVHGGVALIVLVEGLVVNRIPVRIKHVVFILAVSCLYILWSILHSVFDVGNPNRSDGDPETDDDAIYGSLGWKNNLTKSIIVSVLSVCVGAPLLFGLVWMLSLWSCCCRWDGSNRLYIQRDDDASETGYTFCGIKL